MSAKEAWWTSRRLLPVLWPHQLSARSCHFRIWKWPSSSRYSSSPTPLGSRKYRRSFTRRPAQVLNPGLIDVLPGRTNCSADTEGEVAGHQGPGITYLPISLLHSSPVPARWVSSGGRCAWVSSPVYDPDDVVTVDAAPSQESRNPKLDVLILGGLPRQGLLQALEDYQAGRLGTIPVEPHPGHEVLRDTTTKSR